MRPAETAAKHAVLLSANRAMRAVSCVAACLMFSVGEGYRLAGGRALGRPPVSSRIARAHLARPPLGASTAAAPAGEAGGAPKAELELVEMPFVGLMRDARAKSKYALSDLTDGLNVKCVAASIFMFFACIAPAIAFGGLLERATAGAMGTMEMVAATSACGMLYGTFASRARARAPRFCTPSWRSAADA